MTARVAAVIPQWNRAELLETLLTLLPQQTRPFDRIIVVDNGSTDGSPELAEPFGVEVIRLGSNLGFAAAVNRGIAAASTDCEWIAILNNDVTLAPRWLERLLEAGQSGYFATGKNLSAADHSIIDGTWDEVARSACAYRCGAGQKDGPQWNDPRLIRMTSMTAALFRRALFQEIGPLDERFVTYFEDVDFGLRCAKAKRTGFYEPAAVAYHQGSSTWGRRESCYSPPDRPKSDLTDSKALSGSATLANPGRTNALGFGGGSPRVLRSMARGQTGRPTDSVKHLKCNVRCPFVLRPIARKRKGDFVYFAGHILEALLVASTAAIIVAYNSADVIGACLAALKTHAPDVQALVVDNASNDSTVEVARQHGVEVIANRENRGFAGAVNQAFAATDTPLVLVLNPDVSLASSLSPLESVAMRHGVAGGRLSDEHGETQAGFTIRRFPTPAVLGLELLGLNRLWPSNSANQNYRYLDRDLTQPGPADQPAGAFLMVRRDVWERLRGLDESFWPIWFEDVDFCRRAAALGFQPYYEPSTTACHLGGHSIKKIDGASKQVFWYDSLLRYAGKHYSGGQYRWICVAALLGAGPRAILGLLQDRSFKEVGKYLKILNFVGRRLVSRPPSGLAQRPGSEY